MSGGSEPPKPWADRSKSGALVGRPRASSYAIVFEPHSGHLARTILVAAIENDGQPEMGFDALKIRASKPLPFGYEDQGLDSVERRISVGRERERPALEQTAIDGVACIVCGSAPRGAINGWTRRPRHFEMRGGEGVAGAF